MNEQTAKLARTFAAWKKLSGLRPSPLELERLELLRAETPAALAERAKLEALLLRLGLNDEGLEEFPPRLHPHCGQGLRIWQYPIQYAPYLIDLSRLGIRSYLEVGIRHGGTFVATVEYLDRFCRLERAVGVDIIPCPSVETYSRAEPRARFARVDASSPAFGEFLAREGPFDLVFIDSFHEEEQVRAELEALRPWARLLAFHDIANERYPGVERVWREVAACGDYTCREYVERYPDVALRTMGIGLAIPRGWPGAGDERPGSES